MKVLIGCECSGIVRDEFTKRGHDAWSCDLKPSERPGQHIQGDELTVLDRGWDLAVCHPPCTYLAAMGIWWNAKRPERWPLTHAARDLVAAIWAAPIPRLCIENPIGFLNRNWMKPAQIIHPWQFGHEASKPTCLWLRGLPKLKGTKLVGKGEFYVKANGSRMAKWSHITSGTRKDDRARIASQTFPGIAEAMAEQWGSFDGDLESKGAQDDFGLFGGEVTVASNEVVHQRSGDFRNSQGELVGGHAAPFHFGQDGLSDGLHQPALTSAAARHTAAHSSAASREKKPPSTSFPATNTDQVRPVLRTCTSFTDYLVRLGRGMWAGSGELHVRSQHDLLRQDDHAALLEALRGLLPDVGDEHAIATRLGHDVAGFTLVGFPAFPGRLHDLTLLEFHNRPFDGMTVSEISDTCKVNLAGIFIAGGEM